MAGATGTIGRPLVAGLLAAGHEVTGMTRSEERAVALNEAGAATVVCDVFDESRLREALAAARPEAVIHQLTALPERHNYRNKALYAPTDRLRGEGTRILLAAAAAAGARRMVVQSVAFMVKDLDPSTTIGASTATLLEMERAVTGSSELEGVVLRYGFFYGPGTHYGEHGSIAKDARKRRYPVVGRGEGVFPFVHLDDAAAATVAAVERGAPGVYEIVDDEPAPMRAWLPVYADAMGAKKPLRVPEWLARLVAGKAAVDAAANLTGGSNAKAKAELGWQPRWPSWRQGFREAPR